jgi:hypothetical protein
VKADDVFYSVRVQIRCTPRQRRMAAALAKRLNVSQNEAWRIALEAAHASYEEETE